MNHWNVSIEEEPLNELASKKCMDLGRKYGLPFVCFVVWVMKSCKAENIRKIYYCTREGDLFKQIHDRVRSSLICREEWPESELLEVSRMATFLPSLGDCNRQDFSQRLWIQYDKQSFLDFFNTLNISIEEAMPFLNTHKLCENDLPSAHNDNTNALWNDHEFIEWLGAKKKNAKRLILKYLSQKKISQQTSSFAMVDIGWRGTIQDNLAYILPDTHITGFYFGLLPVLNRQPSNTTKLGFCNHWNRVKEILKSPTPIEFMTSSSSGSVVGYENDRCAVRPIYAFDNNGKGTYNSFLTSFQKGVIFAVDELIEHSFSIGNIDSCCFRRLYKLICYPNIIIAKVFFNSAHSEMFGLGKIVIHHRQLPLEIFFIALFKRGGMKILRDFLNSKKWPQAFLRIHHLSFLIPVYNLILWKENKPNTEYNEFFPNEYYALREL